MTNIEPPNEAGCSDRNDESSKRTSDDTEDNISGNINVDAQSIGVSDSGLQPTIEIEDTSGHNDGD